MYFGYSFLLPSAIYHADIQCYATVCEDVVSLAVGIYRTMLLPLLLSLINIVLHSPLIIKKASQFILPLSGRLYLARLILLYDPQ